MLERVSGAAGVPAGGNTQRAAQTDMSARRQASMNSGNNATPLTAGSRHTAHAVDDQ